MVSSWLENLYFYFWFTFSELLLHSVYTWYLLLPPPLSRQHMMFVWREWKKIIRTVAYYIEYDRYIDKIYILICTVLTGSQWLDFISLGPPTVIRCVCMVSFLLHFTLHIVCCIIVTCGVVLVGLNDHLHPSVLWHCWLGPELIPVLGIQPEGDYS